MAEEYETYLHRWFGEVWNKKREEAVDEMFSHKTINHGSSGAEGEAIIGIEVFKEFHRAFLKTFPDIQVTVEDVITDGEKMAARYTARTTHTGDGLGVAPTNQQVEFTGMGICIIKDGKFAEIWNEVDFMKMYSQLGILRLGSE